MMGLDQSCLNWMIFCNVPCSSCRLGHSVVGMVTLCKEHLVSSAGDYDVLASSGLWLSNRAEYYCHPSLLFAS